MHHQRRYLRIAFLVAAGTVVIAGAINWLVDPYRFFDVIEAPGFNKTKPRASQRAAASKMYALERSQPRTVVLGNSRSEVGFDPQSSAWPSPLQPVYNAALPGTGPATSLEYLRHAVAVASIRTAVIGLDFLDFRVRDADPPHNAGNANDTAPRDALTWHRRASDYLAAIVSLTALSDSIITIWSQRNEHAADVDARGFNPMLDYVQIAKSEGYSRMFRQRNQENARNFIRGPKKVIRSDDHDTVAWESVRGMFGLCSIRRIPCRFVIYPYHGHTLELFRLSGLAPAFELWKRRLVHIAHDITSRQPDSDIVIWDFSGFHAYATEAVPADVGGTTRWYWEAGHFKKALGDRMLRRMFDDGTPNASSDSQEFGRPLTLTGIGQQVDLVTEGHKAYLAQRPAELAQLRQMVDGITRNTR